MKTNLRRVSKIQINYRKSERTKIGSVVRRVHEPLCSSFGLYRKRPALVSRIKRVRQERDILRTPEERIKCDSTVVYEDADGHYNVYKRYFVQIGEWRFIKHYLPPVTAKNVLFDLWAIGTNQIAAQTAFRVNYTQARYLAFFTQHGHGTVSQLTSVAAHMSTNAVTNGLRDKYWKPRWHRNLWLERDAI